MPRCLTVDSYWADHQQQSAVAVSTLGREAAGPTAVENIAFGF
jgi:hypothetical protein